MTEQENPVPVASAEELLPPIETANEASNGRPPRRAPRRRTSSKQSADENAAVALGQAVPPTEDAPGGGEAVAEPAPVRRTRGRGRRAATPATEETAQAVADEQAATEQLSIGVEEDRVEAGQLSLDEEVDPSVVSAPETAATPSDAVSSSNPWAPRRRYEVGPDGTVRFLDVPAVRPVDSTETQDGDDGTPAPVEPVAPSEAVADGARRRRTRRGGRRLEPDVPAVIASETVDESGGVAVADELDAGADDAAEIDQGIIEGEAAAEGEEQTRERRRRRSRRGGRGRRRNEPSLDGAEIGEALDADLAVADGIALPDEDETEPEEPPMITPLRGRAERNAPNLSPLESLVARQNVILDQLLQRQERMARSMEQALKSVEARLRGTDLSRVSAMPRLAVFVDVPNIMYAAEQYRVQVDFGKLLDYVAHDRTLIRASAYAPISDDPSQRLEIQRFVEPFVNHGYRIVTKPLKRFADGSIKANFDVELAMDILTMSDRLDIVSLVSGDGDFRRLVDIVASKGVRVEVVSFARSTSAELKAVADSYIDLTQHLKDLCVPVEGEFKPRVPRPRIDISGYYE